MTRAKKRKLTITLSADWRAGLKAAGKTAAKGIKTGRYQGEVLNFETPAILFSQLTEKRWELVRLLQTIGPVGVRELARQAGRGVRRVHDDAQALIELGLIEKTDERKLVCPYADIHVDMHVRAA